MSGQQLVGSSDWPDFEGDASFTVPPKPIPELYTLQGDQVTTACAHPTPFDPQLLFSSCIPPRSVFWLNHQCLPLAAYLCAA